MCPPDSRREFRQRIKVNLARFRSPRIAFGRISSLFPGREASGVARGRRSARTNARAAALLQRPSELVEVGQVRQFLDQRQELGVGLRALVTAGRFDQVQVLPHEHAHTLAALRFLRVRVGNWALLAKALGFEKNTMFNVKKGTNEVSTNMAYRVSRLAGVPFDDVTSGRYPVKGMCPHCGHVPRPLEVIARLATLPEHHDAMSCGVP
jgi:hypothetical protein